MLVQIPALLPESYMICTSFELALPTCDKDCCAGGFVCLVSPPPIHVHIFFACLGFWKADSVDCMMERPWQGSSEKKRDVVRCHHSLSFLWSLSSGCISLWPQLLPESPLTSCKSLLGHSNTISSLPIHARDEGFSPTASLGACLLHPHSWIPLTLSTPSAHPC